jgi:predicted alpha/beta superfamily hydrolase
MSACNKSEPVNPVLALTGNVEFINGFESDIVDDRNIDIWLPEGYSESDQRYRVLYMHDGQNVFNPATSYNGNDWMVDEAMTELVATGEVEPAIVVAVWNNGAKRFPEYMPQKPAEVMNREEIRKGVMAYAGVPIISDDYLRFLVEELKPYVDSTYRTRPEPEFTSIMGSSMGGLISLYAISEYPDVFGSAACLSTHWTVENGLGEAYISQVEAALPDPESHKIYFDYGTEGLDADYEPGQMKVDTLMLNRGYIKGENWMTLKFEGHDHKEQYWAMRIKEPLRFLLND